MIPLPTEGERIIPPYHTQRNNRWQDGTADTATQCWIASNTMLVRSVGIATGTALAELTEDQYLNDLATLLSGNPKADIKKDSRRFEWEPHRKLVNNYLNQHNIAAEAVTTFWRGNIAEAMERESPILPVTLGISISSVLPGASGHMILAGRPHAVPGIGGMSFDGIDALDPYGDARNGYREHNGELVWYSNEWLRKLQWPHAPNVLYVRGIV